MNPRSVNSVNIKTFGFKTIFDTENNKIIFDITGLTEFESGGAANVTGISFEVIDPFNIPVHVLQWVTPDMDPNVDSTFEVQLSGSTPAWGIYKVRGVIREADGITDYEVVIPPKNVCEPKGFVAGVVIGSFKEKVDCNSPYIRLNETSDLTYLSKKYDSITKAGNLYYPQGTISPIAFTGTPFQNGVLYTGDYVVRNKSIADYDLGDYFFVRISYETSYKFNVTCQSLLCDVACCIEEVYNTSKEFCNTTKGKDAKRKLDDIQIHVLTAVSKEHCGKDSGEQIKIIRDILKCDCDCTGKLIEPTPVQAGGGNALVFEGECATEVDINTVGSTTTIKYKTKNVIVAKGVPGDTAFSIQKVEDACNITYKITFDYAAIAENVINSENFVTEINNLIGDYISNNETGGINIREINGRCIIDLTKCDYALSYDIPVNGATITAFTIGSNTYSAPGGGLAVNSPSAIQSWLNNLMLGVFNVGYTSDGTGGVFIITSNNSEFIPLSADFMVSAVSVNKPIARSCKTLEQILDALIEYICNLDASQVALGEAMSICNIVGGVVVPTAYSPTVKVNTFLKALALSYCNLVNTVNSLASLSCSTIVGLFGTSGAPIGATDFFLGTKGGTCAKGTIKDLAIAIFQLAQTDGAVKAEFCAVSCTTEACPAWMDLVVTDDD